jgi:hypothetical protein
MKQTIGKEREFESLAVLKEVKTSFETDSWKIHALRGVHSL